MSSSATALDIARTEKRVFNPSQEFSSLAHIRSMEEYTKLYKEAQDNPEGFWARIAGELHWFKTWDKVLEWNSPWANWFVGGEINMSYNCLDRQVQAGRANKTAIRWEGEPGETRTLTYSQMLAEVSKFANVLTSLGVQQGDRVAIYMGMVPELAIAMLACARIGAPHTVIFGGFSANSITDRVQDCDARVIVTQDAIYRKGLEIKLKAVVDEAVKSCPSVRDVVVYCRTGLPVDFVPGRDHWWHDLMADASDVHTAVPVKSDHPLFLLYTSGTTGKPKGVLHTTGGYSVATYITAKWVFDLKEDDVFWCTADIGWITGHSYVVYGPLQNGATCVMYEGAPIYPQPDRLWELVDRH